MGTNNTHIKNKKLILQVNSEIRKYLEWCKLEYGASMSEVVRDALDINMKTDAEYLSQVNK